MYKDEGLQRSQRFPRLLNVEAAHLLLRFDLMLLMLLRDKVHEVGVGLSILDHLISTGRQAHLKAGHLDAVGSLVARATLGNGDGDLTVRNDGQDQRHHGQTRVTTVVRDVDGDSRSIAYD